jgi:hypothetical protein
MATEPGNANEAFNRTSLNKPLPALPHPYFEYLFANAGVEKQAKAKKTFKPFIDTAGKPSYGVVKSSKNNSYDFVKPGLESNPQIDLVKRDSDGFSIPDIPASAYPGAVGKENTIDNLSVAEEVQDAGSFAYALFPSVNLKCRHDHGG